MLQRLNRLDRLIAESEARIIEQVFLIMDVRARGGDSAAATRSLKAFELILQEYRRLRDSSPKLGASPANPSHEAAKALGPETRKG